MANPFSLEGKNAWITGASYGIGFNIAKAFVAAGIKNIIFNDINEAALERGLANYKEAGITNVHGYVCDVTDENAVKALVEKIHAEVGQIDILVNNAGIIKRIPMHEMKRQEFQQVIDVDLVAPFIVASAVIPEMMERKEGKIINICSMMSELGRETVSAYAAAKGGLKMLTRNICSEYGEYNIQCNGIGPGYIAYIAFNVVDTSLFIIVETALQSSFVNVVEDDGFDASSNKCLSNVETNTVRCTSNPSVLTL